MEEDSSNKYLLFNLQELCSSIDIFLKIYNEYVEKLETHNKLKAIELDPKKRASMMLLLYNYGSKEKLESELYRSKLKFEELQSQLEGRCGAIQKILESNYINCGHCEGSGKVKTEKIERSEWNTMQPYIETKDCPSCQGIGKLKINDTSKKYAKLVVDATRKVIDMSRRLTDTIVNVPEE
jgi:hypothetical protein